MIGLISKLINVFARLRLMSCSGVVIGPGSRINYRGVHLRPGCELTIGSGCLIEGNIWFERPSARVSIGSNTFMGSSMIATADYVEIGSHVLIAWGCCIVDHNSHSLDWRYRMDDTNHLLYGQKDWIDVKIQPVKICDNAWIGFNAILLKEVTIGKGSIVAAGSVVTKDVPPFTLVAGNPAGIIRELPREES